MNAPLSNPPSAAPLWLTIGIPTFNFGNVIGETLASIADQDLRGVEILVVDGASTDDTQAAIGEWQERLPQLNYVRLPQKGGIDADMATTVALAAAPYVWLFSGDDQMRPGAVERVRAALADAPDLCLVTHSDCEADMALIADRHPLLSGGDRRFDLTDSAQRAAYFGKAESSEAFFSFMSGLVISRAAWDSAPADLDLFAGSCWSHAARLLWRVQRTGLTIQYLATPLIDRRGDNDSFRGNGIVQRYALAIDGYRRIVSHIFGANSIELRQLRRVLRAEFTPLMFYWAKLDAERHPERESMTKLFELHEALHRSSHLGLSHFAFRRVRARTYFRLRDAASSVKRRLIGRAR